MEKWLCWGSIGVCAFLVLLFLADLVFAILGRLSPTTNVITILASTIVIFLAWDTLRELR